MSKAHGNVVIYMAVAIATAAVTWGYAQQRMAGMLSPQDYLEIQQLYSTYNRTLDAGDAEAFASTFTPDGVLANSTGREALMKAVQNAQQNWKGNWRHLYSNLVLTPTKDGADGSSFLFAYDVGTKPATITNTGIYDDVLVKTPAGWRFKRRTFRNDASASR